MTQYRFNMTLKYAPNRPINDNGVLMPREVGEWKSANVQVIEERLELAIAKAAASLVGPDPTWRYIWHAEDVTAVELASGDYYAPIAKHGAVFSTFNTFHGTSEVNLDKDDVVVKDKELPLDKEAVAPKGERYAPFPR